MLRIVEANKSYNDKYWFILTPRSHRVLYVALLSGSGGPVESNGTIIWPSQTGQLILPERIIYLRANIDRWDVKTIDWPWSVQLTIGQLCLSDQ